MSGREQAAETEKTVVPGITKKAKYRIFILAVLIAGVLTGVVTTRMHAAAKEKLSNLQEHMAGEVLRFHVLANSDTTADQNLKLDVRDAVLAAFGEKLEGCTTKGESMALLAAYKEEIRQTAAAEIARQGYDYPVSVSLVREDFPEKTYGNLVFPAGVYDAVRIEIGEAQGHNWWCVLYPQMCYVDAAWGEPTEEGRERLQKNLTEEEYAVVSAAEQTNKAPKIKLKIVEMWQGD